MVKIGDELRQAEIITLAEACRHVGISVPTALKLLPKEYPEAFWLGGKRVIAVGGLMFGLPKRWAPWICPRWPRSSRQTPR
jgi:hypothetical protein